MLFSFVFEIHKYLHKQSDELSMTHVHTIDADFLLLLFFVFIEMDS